VSGVHLGHAGRAATITRVLCPTKHNPFVHDRGAGEPGLVAAHCREVVSGLDWFGDVTSRGEGGLVGGGSSSRGGGCGVAMVAGRCGGWVCGCCSTGQTFGSTPPAHHTGVTRDNHRLHVLPASF
jgi:hypothetical protein